ncbi:RPA-related protein RADX [Phytophthora citrophthora]|uniref:RPA-related protein RADX n=1 Tax=Phytophthora citrophthora TaxID=4793 RepID=A0AAD9GL87_9STRA|nr:RPA-related protein RADX [Phytophthora citrophthora]
MNLVDPAAKQRLGQQFQDIRDVFDVLLSDGRHKMKAVLSPRCNQLVWKRKLTARSIVEVTKFKVFMENEQNTYRAVVLEDVEVLSFREDGVLPDKVVTPRFGAQVANDHLPFVSTEHPREVGLLPLVGERVYYLPIGSDHYTLDWQCSFTNGIPDQDSPLDELENNWYARYGDDDDQEQMQKSVAWNSVPEYCSSLFTPGCKKLRSLIEALDVAKENKDKAHRKLSPHMIGVLRVKSQVMNLGEPDVANPFPFAFNAVVVDATGVLEVMFFGSMCAKYYLSLHEGDLCQFRDYSFIDPMEIQWTMSKNPLMSYPHKSTGRVYHVPKKYWKLLENTEISPPLHDNDYRPSWLECNFVTSLNAHYLGNSDRDFETMYFDFVGVLSNVGKVIRSRKRRLGGEAEVTEYRWVKMIDSSSSYEVVIKLSECSQPASFQDLEAGQTLMITKLQWVVLPGADRRIQYATTSSFSVLRRDEEVNPFHSIEECNLNVYFANNVRKNAVLYSRKTSGESRLTAHIEKKYRPRNHLPTSIEEFKEAFDLKVCTFRDLSDLHLEAYENQHVGFVGQVIAISEEDEATNDRSSVYLRLSEHNKSDQFLTVAVTMNVLCQKPGVEGTVKTVTQPELLPLIRLLPAEVVGEMYAKAIKGLPVRTRRSKTPKLSLDAVGDFLKSSKRDYFFSLQVYCDEIGHVTWEVDAILAVP